MYAGGIFQTPSSVAVAGYGYNLAQFASPFYIAQGGGSEKFERNGKSYERKMFQPEAKSSYIKYTLSYPGADYWRVADGENFNFMHYTTTAGYSNVWAVRTKMLKEKTDEWCNFISQMSYVTLKNRSGTTMCF